MNTQQQMSGKELSSALKSHRAAAKIFELLCIGCALGMAGLLIAGKYLFGILMLIPMIAFALLMSGQQSAIKNLISGNIVQGLLEKAFDHVAYAPSQRISDEVIGSSHMVFYKPYEKISGDDYIDAEYKGLHLKMSDITLTRKEEHYDSEKDDWEESEETIFKGQWLTCDFAKELYGEVHLSAATRNMVSSYKKARIRMENEAFNEKFIVTADDPEEAFYILTPHMMEYILHVAETHRGNLYMSFLRDGKFHIAANTGEDFFELGKKSTDPEKLSQAFLEEIRWYTDIIDQLRIEPNLYK